MTEREPPDDPEDDENPEFDRFEEAMKKLLDAKPADESGRRDSNPRHGTDTTDQD